MEGALGEYHRVAPGVPLTSTPMKCFVFGTREQWVDFTRRNTGPDAFWYLKINRGGYTVRDWYVSYYVGEKATLSVAAHEGWHQFASRHFKGRLPPFLEEGIATMFEDLRWTALDGGPGTDLPRWNLLINRDRGRRPAAGRQRRVRVPAGRADPKARRQRRRPERQPDRGVLLPGLGLRHVPVVGRPQQVPPPPCGG